MKTETLRTTVGKERIAKRVTANGTLIFTVGRSHGKKGLVNVGHRLGAELLGVVE
jgi:hypothetical protein